MASYNELNALIDAYINRNGVQAITGQILNGVLKAMVEQLGRGYTIMGAAIPTTDPGTPDGPECYFASETGTYTDFDGLQVVPGELALLCYTPTDGWTKATIYEGFQEVGATIDENVGTPSVGVSYANGVLSFDFRNMKGNTGDAAGFGTIGADITGVVGTPGVTVESSGPATAKNLQFHFTNLKGETGVTSVVATVDNTTGTPTCTVSLVGQQLTLAFSGLKGAQGDTGSSVDYPFTIVNNLTTDDATQALSAAQGVVLDGKVTQLEAKVTGLVTKELTWSNGFINVSGKIQNSTASKYTQPFLLKKGEKVTVGTRNTSITILGSTTQQSLTTGDIITPIQTTSTTDRFETYEYIAQEDITIVVCVKWADYTLSFYDTDCIEERITNLESDVDNLSEENKRGIYSGIAKYSVVPSAFVPGLYWYKENNKIAHLDNNGTMAGLSVPIPVEHYDRVCFSVTAGNTQYFILATDDAGNVIESFTGTYITTLGGEYVVPANATKLYLNTLQTDVHNSFAIVLGGYLDKMLNDTENIFDTISSPLVASVQVGKGVNASTGEIVDDANQNAVVVDLSAINAKYIQFIWVVSGTYGYGFVVNGVWQGRKTSFFPSGNYEKQTVPIPEGATEFRMSWNTQTYTGQNIPRAILADAMEKALDGEKQISVLNSALYKEQAINVSEIISGGGVATDGTISTNNGYGHLELVLNESVSYKNFTFPRTYANPATHNCYGFVVGGQWIGYPGNPSASDSPTQIKVDVPAGATAFKVCWNRNQLTDANFYLRSEMFDNTGDEEKQNNPVFQFCPDFNLNRVPTYPCPTAGQAGLLKPADLYAMYDALMATYPDYITKVDCDAVAQEALEISAPAYMDGLPIYMYKFSPKIGGNGAGVDQTSRVKVLLTSMHPQEKLGLYTTYYTAKMICENWANDVNAEQLRSLVDIYIMPCPWPWNMQNDSRGNYNGVNGNRNFPTRKWQESGQGTYNWTGTAPLTEYEAKVISYFLLQIKPDVSVDVHTSGNDEVGHMGIFNMNQYDQPLVDLCGIIARTTSNRAIQDNPNFPSSPDTCLYGVYPEDGSYRGEFYQYAFEQGCRYSVLSEESPYSKWNNGVYNNSGSIVEQYTDGIQKEQVQYLFNTLLRLTRAACEQYYKS